MTLDTAKLDAALAKADALGARMDRIVRRADAQSVLSYIKQETNKGKFAAIGIRAIAGSFYLTDNDDQLLSSPSFLTRQAAEQYRSKALDKAGRADDAEFEESKHSRDESGRFGRGGGSTRPGVEHGTWEAPKKHKDGAETHRFPVQLRNGKTGYHEVYKTPSGESIVTMSHGYSRKVPSFEEAKKFVESHHN